MRVQIWTALCSYLLVGIAKQQKNLAPSMYEVLQIGSDSLFKRIALPELLVKLDAGDTHVDVPNQLGIKYS